MKSQKLITLDIELNKKLLQEKNASSLISKLLEEYFKKKEGKLYDGVELIQCNKSIDHRYPSKLDECPICQIENVYNKEAKIEEIKEERDKMLSTIDHAITRKKVIIGYLKEINDEIYEKSKKDDKWWNNNKVEYIKKIDSLQDKIKDMDQIIQLKDGRNTDEVMKDE